MNVPVLSARPAQPVPSVASAAVRRRGRAGALVGSACAVAVLAGCVTIGDSGPPHPVPAGNSVPEQGSSGPGGEGWWDPELRLPGDGVPVGESPSAGSVGDRAVDRDASSAERRWPTARRGGEGADGGAHERTGSGDGRDRGEDAAGEASRTAGGSGDGPGTGSGTGDGPGAGDRTVGGADAVGRGPGLPGAASDSPGPGPTGGADAGGSEGGGGDAGPGGSGTGEPGQSAPPGPDAEEAEGAAG